MKSSTSGISNADLYDVVNPTPVRTIVRTANKNKNNKNKEISRSGLVFPVEYLRNGKRYFEFRFHFQVVQESYYQTV